jgi:hypothetical protein
MPTPQTNEPDWRAIAFELAKFARHQPHCHKHPFDNSKEKCHCGYQEAFNTFKEHERTYYLGTIKKAA